MDRKDELLAYLLKREGFERQSDYSIPSRDHDEVPPPVSFAQERFWFLDQFEHAHPVYNGCKVVRLIGQLNIDILAECLNLIVRRHEVLRTTYPTQDGRPIQYVESVCSIEISVADLTHLSESELPHAIDRLVRAEWLEPINLSEELPIRVRLVQIDHAHNLLILTLHQIAVDSQSVVIFFRELWTAYEAKLKGKEPALPTLPVQYGDFSSWQRRRVLDQTFASHHEYWMQRLSGILPLLNFPTDKPRPPVQGFEGSRLPILLPNTLQLKLKDLSRENGVTFFMTLLAAFKTLLYRFTSQEDLVVGCPVLNRGLPEIENLLGSFVNTLVLRTNYTGKPGFRDVLRRVRETCIGAFAHQDFPFEKLVEALQPQRDLARNPIFQVMFAFQNATVPALELPDLRSEPLEIEGGMTKFDLTLSLFDKEHEITGHIEYSADLFNRDTIARVARHFQTLLESIIADPGQSIATLPIMARSERQQILFQWNDTAADYPKNKCIHELFEAQAERTPEAIAVQFEGKQLTYRELNSRANQLAHYLQGLGVGPEKLVGICVERSLEMVVGLLGILKAGGAYVPLDPGYPRERLDFMLRDAEVSVLLTQESLMDGRWRSVSSPSTNLTVDSTEGMDEIGSRSPVLSPRLIWIDHDWEKIAPQSEENPKSRVTTQNLVYVIYTSGSSGRPKGVMITHGGISNRLLWMQDRYRLVESDHVLHKTPISFDVSVWEIFWPLLNGAVLVVARPGGHQDSAYLAELVVQQKINALHFVPSMLRVFLEETTFSGCPDLKLVVCSGEALSVDLQERFFDRFDAELHNLYGPTEASIDATSWACERRSDRSLVPIGKPIANSQIYILDSLLQPAPVGVHGELYIGGDGLARGYLNRPELTAEKFVANPFSNEPGARLYRTGDGARYLPDGNIEFLGRLDNQVKIRGHRIELGEIEAALTQHPSIKETVVVARALDSSQEKELIGYIVSTQSSVSVDELRRFLGAKLPHYMLPARFLFLDALPLTPNGKIDRNALPSPDRKRAALDQGFIEPRTEVEELVAQMWREVLKLEKVGVHDNFFDLGGHSLLATRVIARLRNNFRIDLPLRKLFELPTVAGLAEHIAWLRLNEKGLSVPPIVSVRHDQPLRLSFSQRRLWFLHELDPGLTAYNIPARFKITGTLSVPALEGALNEIIKRHEVLRTRIIEIDGQPLQEILPNAAIELRVVDLSDLPEGEAEAMRVSADDVRQPYNLAEAPLMRAKLLRLNEQEHVLILNFHHIVCDGSSLVIFYRELATLYEAFLEGKDFTMPSLPVQYADYAVWQHERLEGDALGAQLAYWKRQLGTGLTMLDLPTDYEPPGVQTYHGARVTHKVSEEVTKALKELSRQQSVTLFMTLLTTVDILLARHAGQDDVVVGSTVAGRNRPEVEGLIGFFINALALRMDLSENPTFLGLLKQVREVCLDAYTHQDLPFEKVVEGINPERDLSRNPLFQVLFNMVDISERILELAGCQVAKLPSPAPDAKFDIVLHAPEVDGKLELAIVYNADLFTESRISSLLEQFSDLLGQVVENPGLRIDQYSLVPLPIRGVLPDPTQSLDDAWEGAIYELLSRQANRVPDCLAVVDRNESWTYRELDSQSNQLANCLITRGIRPRDVVAIYAHRSAPLALALLSVLKSGAVFVILDPAYPVQRLIDYLKIAQPKGWLQMEAAGELPEGFSGFLDSLEISCRITIPRMKNDIEGAVRDYSRDETGVPLDADDPAYIAFTSGSTGQPKGVLCRHGPMTHFLPWQEEQFDLRSTDRFCLLSGLAYNHLHRDAFTPLALGATLYVPSAEIVREPLRLTEWLQENSISALHLTPALGQLLLTVGAPPLTALRRVFFGGDVLTRGEVVRIRELAPNAIIGSFYGATETQRAVGYFQIPDGFPISESDANRTVPLGRGVKDIQLLLLNKNRQLAGVGELAELYVRSPHLAAGYVGDQERTHEMFVINPFTNDAKDRMYKTGELGRYLPDGNVEWAGRNDRRVNIRGFRIELEEIESVLKQHPAVANAAIVLQDYEISSPENLRPETRNPKPDQRLVAYVVAAEKQQSLVDLLHSYVSARLPDYMMPAHFVVLQQLPLSPNGKVDYQVLPPVYEDLSQQWNPTSAPQNEVQAKLRDIFLQVLAREEVGIEDNFFRLGGHSLSAAQAAARIREAFGISLELRTFLQSPTIGGLAKEIQFRITMEDATLTTRDTDREEIEL